MFRVHLNPKEPACFKGLYQENITRNPEKVGSLGSRQGFGFQCLGLTKPRDSLPLFILFGGCALWFCAVVFGNITSSDSREFAGSWGGGLGAGADDVLCKSTSLLLGICSTFVML